jgi:hypothetical protein
MYELKPRFFRPLITGFVTALLAIHAWLAVSATINLGVTGDETVHLTGGYSYWRLNDYRLHPENGNLPQRWAALPLLISNPTLDPASRPELWRASDAWQIGQNFFFESGNSIDYALFCARTMAVTWSVATGLLVFFWSRRLWGELGALFSLVLYVVSPTTLAHGSLVTSDMCAAFWLLAATGAWWRLTERITFSRLVVSLASVGFAVVAKFSSILLVPTFAAIALWRLFKPGASIVVFGGRTRLRGTLRSKFVLLGVAAGAHLFAAWGIVWAFFGFRYSAFASDMPVANDFFASFASILPAEGIGRWMFLQATEYQVLPEAFIQGLAYVFYAARERPAFLAGEYGSTGWWWFFPFAFFVKSSITELIVSLSLPAIAVFAWLRNRAGLLNRVQPLVPLLAFAGIYLGASIFSHLNIGQRHILPLYPVLFILGGSLIGKGKALVAGAQSRFEKGESAHSAYAGSMRRWSGLSITELPVGVRGLGLAKIIVLIILMGAAVFESARVRPDFLAYFNHLAGGPANGWRLLGDSSLDWGQNLPRLAAWLRVHRTGDERVYLSNFGADDPFYRGIGPIELSPYYSFGRELRWEGLREGIYCIGASMLQDASSPYRGAWTQQREAHYQQLRARITGDIEQGIRSPVFMKDGHGDVELWSLDRARFARLCTYLRLRKPTAVVGHTIFIFRLSEQEIRASVSGNLADLVAIMESALAESDMDIQSQAD